MKKYLLLILVFVLISCSFDSLNMDSNNQKINIIETNNSTNEYLKDYIFYAYRPVEFVVEPQDYWYKPDVKFFKYISNYYFTNGYFYVDSIPLGEARQYFYVAHKFRKFENFKK